MGALRASEVLPGGLLREEVISAVSPPSRATVRMLPRRGDGVSLRDMVTQGPAVRTKMGPWELVTFPWIPQTMTELRVKEK